MTLLEMAQQIGLTPKLVAHTAGGEYHSWCPRCGGDGPRTNRFRIQPNKQMKNCKGYYECRKCGIKGDSIQFARDFLGCTYEEALKTVNATIIPKLKIGLPMHKPIHNNKFAALNPPPQAWSSSAIGLVERAHAYLLQRPDLLAYLAARGLPVVAVRKYKLGFLETDQFLSRRDWGLDEQLKEDGTPRLLWIPRGFAIPTIEPSGTVIRMKIRRSDWKADDSLPKYVAVSGSMNGLTIIGNQKSLVVIVVESELDAYAIHNAVGDFACVIAIGGCVKGIDNVTNAIIKRAQLFLICNDNDDAGSVMLHKWKNMYPAAVAYPTPMGKDIGEAVQQGLQLREWLLAAIATSQNTQTGLAIATVIDIQALAPSNTLTTIAVQTKTWSPEAQELVVWSGKYLEYIKTHSPQTHHIYVDIEQDIAKGPEGDHVEPFIYKLRMMKQTIEQAPIYNGSPFHAFMVK